MGEQRASFLCLGSNLSVPYVGLNLQESGVLSAINRPHTLSWSQQMPSHPQAAQSSPTWPQKAGKGTNGYVPRTCQAPRCPQLSLERSHRQLSSGQPVWVPPALVFHRCLDRPWGGQSSQDARTLGQGGLNQKTGEELVCPSVLRTGLPGQEERTMPCTVGSTQKTHKQNLNSGGRGGKRVL